MCNNYYNGCRDRYDGGECGYQQEYNCQSNYPNRNCGYHCGWYGDAAFAEAARINQRIMARRACEDRAAMHFLRNLNNCRRCW